MIPELRPPFRATGQLSPERGDAKGQGGDKVQPEMSNSRFYRFDVAVYYLVRMQVIQCIGSFRKLIETERAEKSDEGGRRQTYERETLRSSALWRPT